MGEQQSNGTVLFVGSDSEHLYGLREFLEAHGYFVYCRDSFVRGFQLMTVYQLDIIICDWHVADTSGLEYCRRLRSDPQYGHTLFMLIGPDDVNCTNCIEALETGADDFVQEPYISEMLHARIKRLMRLRNRGSIIASSTLSGQASSGEFVGILQYLETEMKSGKVEIKTERFTGNIWLREGRIVDALSPNCEGQEAITDMMCWPKSVVTFHEGEVSDEHNSMDAKVTGIIMNCAVTVDEFHEAKGQLPSATSLFLVDKPLPDDADDAKIAILEMVSYGATRDEALHQDELSERVTTLALRDLIADGHLRVLDNPFSDYRATCYNHYKHSTFIENRLLEVRRVLADMYFPIPALGGFVPSANSDWLSPAPRIIITGDNSEHVGLFISSLRQIYAASTGRKPPERKQFRRSFTMRMDLEERAILDIQALPNALEPNMLNSLADYLSDICAVIVLVSAQDRATNMGNIKLIRQLRQRFDGVYYHAAARVATRDQKYMYKINCVHCGYKLAVNMDESGFIGECPICSNPITIPDCLDNLAVALQLPEDVPVLMAEPADPAQCCDMLVMAIDSVLQACNPPTEEISEKKEHGTSTNVRARTNRRRDLQIKVADTRMQRMPEEMLNPDYQDDSSGEFAADEYESAEHFADDEMDEEESHSLPVGHAPEHEAEASEEEGDDIHSLLGRIGGSDLDDILKNDDEDIDDFINKLRG